MRTWGRSWVLNDKTLCHFLLAVITIIGLTITGCEVAESVTPPLTGTVSITGIAEVGETLTADTSSLDGNGTISYQWKRNGSAIPGTNSDTYVVQSADVGYTITVIVTRSGYTGNITSVPTDIVIDPWLPIIIDPELPALTGTVSINGVGITEVTVEMWDSNDDGWDTNAALRINVNGTNLSSNARLSSGGGPDYYTFTVNKGDIVMVYWVNGGQYDSECAFAIYYSNDPPDPAFNPTTGSIDIGRILISKQYNDPYGAVGNGTLMGSFTASATNPTIGQTLTVNTANLGGSGPISYQWNRNGSGGSATAISGAISDTYTIQEADVGYTITVTVTRDGYTDSVTSAPTDIVTNQNPVASDFDIDNLTQTLGSVTEVIITPKEGKSTGAITVYYNGSTSLPTAIGTYTVTFDVAAVTGWNAAEGLTGGTLTIKVATDFSITIAQITDAANELIVDQVISRSGDNGPKTLTLTLDNPDQYSSIAWYVDGVSGTGASFTLYSENIANIGEHFLTLEVWKDGKPYNKTVIFTVVE